MENFKGFSFNTNPFSSVRKNASLLRLRDCDFDFILNAQQPLSSLCIFNSPLNSTPLLSTFDVVNLDDDVNTSRIQCPLIFQNANIKQLIFTNNLTDENKLTFRPLLPSPTTENNISSLNSRIESLEIYKANFRYLDSSFLNPYIFKDLKSFTFLSYISTVNIQESLFEPFKSLKEFKFFVPSLESYIRKQNLSWALSLNSDVNIDLKNQTQIENPLNQELQFKLVITDLEGTYKFADDDFCLFANFPHSQLVFPIINTTPDLDCTCSLIWLLQYSSYYKNEAEMNTSAVRNCFSNQSDFMQLYNECNFDQRIKQCVPDITTPLPTLSLSTQNPSSLAPSSSVSSSSVPSSSVPSSLVSLSSATSFTSFITDSPSSGLDGGQIAGIVLGSVAGISLIAVGGYFLYKYLIKNKKSIFPLNSKNQKLENF